MRVGLVMLLVAIAPLAGAAETVKGRVVYDDGPLPGVTVTLGGREVFTDSEGRYVFDNVPPGSHQLEIELPGFVTTSLRIDVKGPTTVDDAKLELAEVTEPIVMACRACDIELPRSKFDRPLCADQDLNDSLIASMETGDRSAIQLLHDRYRAADSYYEQHRIGAALLGKLDDDRAIWNDLVRDASLVLRFARVNDHEFAPELIALAEQAGVTADELWWTSYGAFGRISADPRSRPLLHQALETADEALISLAIIGLGTQRDTASLPAIERALERIAPELRAIAVYALAEFGDERADALGEKYLGDEYNQYKESHSRER